MGKKKTKGKMSRQEMQDQALVIESLLSTAMAMLSERDPTDAYEMIEKAQDRAMRLNSALDSINAAD
ncbi:hypothetical protein [Roseovarius atlanticus]|uniref:hypothetical protein n=1 Tax=Roseovarius atlanticus TaxID=1641875 RepID=UPI001C941E9C|nr:hypothetical protein [Roseovarius atlanticus]MBY5987080.1 hypothetical protein [Roseovarius atlanticus]MBY6125720.1 hypothetical protein [Roseovarius atlanticus]MBY6149819.1 hypothetical protein [Roseovarius atlanticus]